MGWSALEVISVIFAILIILKVILVLFARSSLLSLRKSLSKSPRIMSLISLALCLLVFYYLIQEITLVQLFTAVVFSSLLIGAMLSLYSKEMIEFSAKILKRRLYPEMWVYYIVLLLFAIVVLKIILL